MNKEKFVQRNYNVVKQDGGVPIKLWNEHVKIEDQAIEQLKLISTMPFVGPHIAAMPDTHLGMGATVGSVIPTKGAVMPAAVGVDIGCGMMAVRTNVTGDMLGDEPYHRSMTLLMWFDEIHKVVPTGRSDNGGLRDIGAWTGFPHTPFGEVPKNIQQIWFAEFDIWVDEFFGDYPEALSTNALAQLGTLGTGNHFIEIAEEIGNEKGNLWVIIHSGSRGFGNKIGSYWTRKAKELNDKWFVQLPNKDLGYLPVDTPEYEMYLTHVDLAQKYAWRSRQIMMDAVLGAMGTSVHQEKPDMWRAIPNVGPVVIPATVHMHHNYLALEKHFGNEVILTRKGAVDAKEGAYVIIPGSMGAKTYIAQGLGNKDSFHSCSHGAGRAMSRGEALKTFTVADHITATNGVVCDKTEGTLDETPGAYKDIDAVMESQKDLVRPLIALKQIVSVKGVSN